MTRSCYCIFTLVAIMVATPAAAIDIVGRPSVIDGDTIEIHGTRIRLWGIDAPEHDQLCRGSDSELYRCGQQAATALAGLLYALPRQVYCHSKGEDQYGRIVAACTVGQPGPDIGHWLVSNGHAVDWPRYSQGEYQAAQSEAQHPPRGIWTGSFAMPWLYRACVRAGGRPARCSDE